MPEATPSTPTFKVGNQEGPYFRRGLFDLLETLAVNLCEGVGITQFDLWYDKDRDYHILGFEYDGHKYTVELYKIYTLHREGEKETRYFEHRREPLGIYEFFKQGKHKLPWPGIKTS